MFKDSDFDVLDDAIEDVDGSAADQITTDGPSNVSTADQVSTARQEVTCSFMLCDLDFEPLSLSLSSMPSCDLESLTNILILCLILKASNQSLRKSLSLNLELS
ncbi:hypothetical protein Tco_0875332 [Tanacetum coccineum]|uniref:Uncharacterized protein n=1 Tax=Tanacetum coccineum TaxID=301880 RepID=A0ABQ5BP60_9ASTR